MRDRDVRRALHEELAREHADELEQTLFVDELGLCGEVRVDVAVVNGSLSGYELKSERDTLRRLPNQVAFYSRVLDFATLVVAESHLKGARELIAPWWGLTLARAHGGEVILEHVKEPEFNVSVDPMSIAQLLWRDEALAELAARGLDRGVRTKPRWVVWSRLVEAVDRDELRAAVRDRLKDRSGWRAD